MVAILDTMKRLTLSRRENYLAAGVRLVSRPSLALSLRRIRSQREHYKA
jgi:hypothetical protein